MHTVLYIRLGRSLVRDAGVVWYYQPNDHFTAFLKNNARAGVGTDPKACVAA